MKYAVFLLTVALFGAGIAGFIWNWEKGFYQVCAMCFAGLVGWAWSAVWPAYTRMLK